MNDTTMETGGDTRSAGYRALICVLLGGLGLLSFGDHFYHVRNGILSYNVGPFIDAQSVFVWPIFVAAITLILAFTSFLTKNATPSSFSKLLLPFAIVHAAYFCSEIWGISHPTELTLALIALWVVRIALTSEYRAQIVVVSLMLAVCGPLGEGFVSMLGLFDYAPTLKQFVSVPYWLSCLYLNAGALAVTAARWIRIGDLFQANQASLSRKTTA
ncbi:DUF2878 domain-containing protein [Burkholderia anthina]|uniref:DUF2878 domain-containing protein n=1 Tax=Burkholderia anthina TaxID=179879 RepID=UPI000F59A7D9|nr:DUF2878 domain-containing protein [Burkholderia anthina]RQV85280.1 DUF2878 domain-containing protein [Burkholderia anthina]